jgi:hypothetical protein
MIAASQRKTSRVFRGFGLKHRNSSQTCLQPFVPGRLQSRGERRVVLYLVISVMLQPAGLQEDGVADRNLTDIVQQAGLPQVGQEFRVDGARWPRRDLKELRIPRGIRGILKKAVRNPVHRPAILAQSTPT